MSDAPKFKTFRDLKSVPKKSAGMPSSPSIASIASPPSNTSPTKVKKFESEISPVRDFQKVPNSIPRNLDLFRGKSKQVWDYLWSVSRGAINPTRTIRKSRNEIKKNSKLGSMVTVDAAIGHLEKIGLIKVIPNIGSIGGNEYEIYTPEETDMYYTSIASIASIASNTSLTQNLVVLDTPESSISSTTQTITKKDSYANAKTSLKTNIKNDDEERLHKVFAPMMKRLNAAVEKLTGKGVTENETEKWGTFADLLILELEAAASRTDNISSVPAFLTEVLRRQFFSTRHNPGRINSTKKRVKKDTVGTPLSESYEVKALNDEEKLEALKQLREFIGEDFLLDFKKWYVEEDWEWLMNNLKSV